MIRALVAMALVLVAACSGSDGGSRDIAQPRPTHALDLPRTTVPTTLILEDSSYDVGACVTWDREATGRIDTFVVPCSDPHLVEMAGSVSAEPLEGAVPEEYPSEDAWSDFFESACTPIIEEQLGVELDPYGRYSPGGIRPIVESWYSGDREVWCGVVYFENPGDDDYTHFAGTFADLDQSDIVDVGKCVKQPDGDEGITIVPCSAPHHLEAVSALDLGTLTQLPTDAQWDELAGTHCRRLAEAYVRRQLAYPSPVAPWIYWIEPESWAAGSRTTTCLVGTFEGDDLVLTTGSLKAGG